MSEMNKTEQATPYKLEKQREKGQVAKSGELNGAMTLFVALIVLSALWTKHLSQLTSWLSQCLISSATVAVTLNSVTHLFKRSLLHLSALLLPLALAIIITVVLMTVLQTGWVWSTQSLAPDFKRLNLAHGFKRYFSVKLLFEGGKHSLKILLICITLSISIKHHLPQLLYLTQQTPLTYPKQLMSLGLTTGFHLFLVLFLFGIIDGLFTRWKYAKDNRMTKQEIKDEHKHREGDPKIKAKIKQVQKELLHRSASLNRVKEADVLITNPTHLAIGLKYHRGEMPAPQVICKACGDLALEAKNIAKRYRIKTVENKTYARALFRSVHLGQYIDQKFFPVAAAIYREIYELQGRAT